MPSNPSARARRALLRTAALAAVLIAAPAAARAAAGPAAITGMWLIDPKDYGSQDTAAEPMALTPGGQALQAKLRQATSAVQSTLSDHSRKCLPIGMPGMMTNEFALEFLETPGRVTILSENSPLPRSVYLTEKIHTTGLEPTWNGHSIGRWEGQGARRTLVIDTVNFNDRIGPINARGVHSPTTHLVERYRLEGPDRLVGEMTFEDPAYLAKPFRTVHHYNRIKGKAELWEYACETDAPGWSERFEGDPAAKLPQK
jgi:hypothetical protein